MKIVLTLLFIMIAGGVLSYKMLNLAQVECGLCVEFKGNRKCTTALGATDQEALDEAHRNACALLAGGVTEVLACQRVERLSVQCGQPGSLK